MPQNRQNLLSAPMRSKKVLNDKSIDSCQASVSPVGILGRVLCPRARSNSAFKAKRRFWQRISIGSIDRPRSPACCFSPLVRVAIQEVAQVLARPLGSRKEVRSWGYSTRGLRSVGPRAPIQPVGRPQEIVHQHHGQRRSHQSEQIQVDRGVRQVGDSGRR